MAAALPEMLVLIHHCAGKLSHDMNREDKIIETHVGVAAGCTSSVLHKMLDP